VAVTLGIAFPMTVGPLRRLPTGSDLLALTGIAGIFSVPAVPLSILGAAVVRIRKANPSHLASLPIGVTVGLLGAAAFNLVVSSSHPVYPDWLVLTLGAGAGACWGVLAPSVLQHAA
jgi:hypothetical protein